MCSFVFKPLPPPPTFSWFSRHEHVVTLLITQILYFNHRWHKLYLHYLMKNNSRKECFCSFFFFFFSVSILR